MDITQLSYPTLQAAWEGFNEYMLLNEKQILKNGAYHGTQLMIYDTYITINKAWVDPEFDFGHTLGYKMKKWTTLVKNYVDIDYLDLLRAEISVRERKKSTSYNYAFHFSNKYGSGKDCLLSIVFTRVPKEPYPRALFSVRVSEITTRLLWDLLLVQRICEYIYGPNTPVEIRLFLPVAYITPERISSFQKYKNILKKLKKVENPMKMQRRVIERIEQFQTIDPETIKYKSNKRFAQNLQGLSKSPPLIAKNLYIGIPFERLDEKDINAKKPRKK